MNKELYIYDLEVMPNFFLASFKNIKTNLGFCGMTDVRFNDLTAIGYLANQRVTVLGNIYQNPELVEE